MKHYYTQKFKLFLVLLIFSLATPCVHAQTLEGELIPFVQTYPDTTAGDVLVIRGDMKVVGNSILGIQDRVDDTDFMPDQEYNGEQRNNGVIRGYIDIDSNDSFNSLFNPGFLDSERRYTGATNTYGSPTKPDFSDTGTFSSSAAELLIDDELLDLGETCIVIEKAFLYWGAMYEKETLDPDNNNRDLERPDCTRPNGDPCEFYTDIKILPPGATEYVDIKFDNTGADYTSLRSEVIIDGLAGSEYGFSETRNVSDIPYACRADVTSLFDHLQSKADENDDDSLPIGLTQGLWTVANVRAVTGRKPTGSGGGWSLVVVYSDPLATFQKSISMFEGYVAVRQPANSPPASVEFNIRGFETIPSGPVNVDLATISLEGDIGIFGDEFQINDENPDQTASNTWVGMTYQGQDARNFFDCSIYSKGDIPRYPNSSNTLGYDSDHFKLDNDGNKYISNSDDAADFRIYTEGDAYGNFFNAFAIEVIAPELDVVKRIFRDDGSEFQEGDEVNLSQKLNYRITITNNGNDDAVDIIFKDILPINTVFLDEEITLNGTVVPAGEITSTPTTSSDTVTGLTFATEEISFVIPDELLQEGETVTIDFSVNVVEDCELLQDVCTNRIQNQADVSYSGAVNNSATFEVRSAFDIDKCETPITGPTVILGDLEFCEDEEQTIETCQEAITLTGGEGFAEYQWFFQNNRVTTNVDGTPISSTDRSITVSQTGEYTLNQIKSTSIDYQNCRDVIKTFNVEVLDPDGPPNPFEDLGAPLDPVCADDGTVIIGIQICNDPINIVTNFQDGTTYSWQKYDDSLGCTQSADNCPYLNASGANCYAEVSTEANYLLADEGSYRLTIELDGNCVFNYYFDAIPIEIDPEIQVTGGVCDDEAFFTVTGVDLTPATNGGVTYEVSFEVSNNGTTTTLPPDTVGGNVLTIPRVEGESYLVSGIVTPDVEGLCPFPTDNDAFIEFIELTATVDVLTQAICTFDDPPGGFDPTVAVINVTATDTYPDYLFNLINVATGQIVESKFETENTTMFERLNPNNTYQVEVFASGETVAGNCSVVVPVEGLEIPLDFKATALVTKNLTCEPAVINVITEVISLGTTTDPNPEIRYTIDRIPGNIYTSDDDIFIDDISNRPDSANEDDVSVPDIDGRIINYIDLTSNSPTVLTISVTSPEGGCTLTETIEISAYDEPTISVLNSKDIDCEGDDDGVIEVESLQGGSAILNPSYELFITGETTPLRTQPSPIFDSLEEGEYTIVVTNSDGCTAATKSQPILEAPALEAPVISVPEYLCENTFTSIQVTTDATGGTAPYTYELFRNGGIDPYRSYTTVAEINADTLPQGTYQLRVTDVPGCTVLSEPGTINTLIVTLDSNPDPVLLQCGANPDPEAQVTVAANFSATGVDAVLSYTILRSTNTSLTGTTNTDGIFTLTAGLHTIEAEITLGTTLESKICTETIDIDIPEIDEVSISAENDFVCVDEEGQLTFNISDFTNDYQYSLESDTGAITPITATTETTNSLVLSGSLLAGDYTLTVIDNTTLCSATANVSIIEQPVELNAVSDIVSTCFGDLVPVTVVPTDNNIANYEYSFGEEATFPATPVYQDSNTISFVPTGTSLIYKYVVRNRTTQCTEEGTLTITQPEELVFVSGVPMNIVCLDDDGDASTSGESEGSYTFEFSGGEPGRAYTFTLFDVEDTTTPLDSKTITKVVGLNMIEAFTPLEARDYIIIVTDSAGCAHPSLIEPFSIIPAPTLGESNTFTLSDCTDKVTLFFEIEVGTGSLNGDDFAISQEVNADPADFIDPTSVILNTDNLFQFGDADFPTSYTTGSFDISNETNRRIFAISNLDFDVVGDSVVILDTSTGCRYTVQYDTDPSPAFVVTPTPVTAGLCDLVSSGLVDLEINNITGAATTVDIEIFRVGGDGTLVVPSITANLTTGSNIIPQISGLPIGGLRVRVQDQNNDCNATAEFIIEVADELQEPIFTEVLEDCDVSAMLVNLSGVGGNPPYSFALSAVATTVSTGLTFVETTTLDPSAFTNANGDIEATLWIKDLNGCENSALVEMEDYVPFAPVQTDLSTSNNCIANQGPTVTINDTATWEGIAPYFYNVPELGNDFIEITSTPFVISMPDEGTYTISFVDAISCPATLDIVVPTSDFELEITNNQPLECTGTGALTVGITTGGVATDVYTFEISEFVDVDGNVTNPNTPGDNGPLTAGTFTEDFTITATGLYTFTVTNETTTCGFSISENIEAPQQLSIITEDDRLTCNADGSGEVRFEIPGYEGDVNYTITNNTTSAVVADGSITNFGDVAATITPLTGTATLDTALGKVTATGFDAGTYDVVLTAGTNALTECSANGPVTITQPDPLIVTLDLVTPFTCVTTSAVIRAEAEGGTGPYEYVLLSGTTVIETNDTGVFDENITDTDGDPSTSDVYFVRVTDFSTICTIDSTNIDITQPQDPIIFTNTTEIVCDGESGSFTIDASGSDATVDISTLTYKMYLFDASQPDNRGAQVVAAQPSPIIDNVFPGTYVLEATDGNGCVSNLEIKVMPEVAPVEFLDPTLVTPISCAVQTEEYLLQAIGGTVAANSNYTFERFAAPYTPLTTDAPLESNITGVFNIVGENYFKVTDDNGCFDTITVKAQDPLVPITFELNRTTDPFCFGESGGFVDVVRGSVSGGVRNFSYNLYLASDLSTPLSATTNPAVSKQGDSFFGDIPPGTYVYEVISDNSATIAECRTTETFTIEQLPELLLEYIEPSEIGCPGDNDGVVRMKVAEADPSNNTGGVGEFVYTIALNAANPKLIEIDDDTTEAVFENLAPGVYVYTIFDNGTNCNGLTGEFTIEEKDPLNVELITTDTPTCEGENDGAISYQISGGTPPYYAVLLDDEALEEPVPADFITDPITLTNIVEGSDLLIVDGDEATTEANIALGITYEAEDLLENLPYRLFIFDSGNGLIGDDLITCDPLLFEFEFETEDLGEFTPASVANCETSDYTVGVTNTNGDLNDEDLIIRLYEIDELGNVSTTQAGNAIADNTLARDNVPAGNYEVSVESLITGCMTTIEDVQTISLEPFTAVQFIVTDVNGVEVQPFIATNEINVYQLQVTGGVNPNGASPYTFEASYVPLESGGLGGVVEVDSDGFFTIDVTGFYTFRVIDNYGDDGETCFDLSDSIGINSIDIDVPNVFNPSSDDPLMNTWYPENLTSDFSNGISPIIDPTPGDGISEPEIPGIVTITDATITGGSITGGTTTGGIVNGGDISGATNTTEVTGATNTNGDTVTYVTVGGSTDASGTTTGGTTIATITDGTTGATSVEIIYGGTVTGGTTSGGVVTGGTVTGGITEEAKVTTSSSGVETYIITTGGTTTGGVTTGGVTTGGTTTISNTSTVEGSTSGGVTIDGTTVNTTVDGGVTTGGTTTIITVPTSGSGDPTVFVSTGTTVTGGIATNGTTTDGIVTGGNIEGGESSESESIEFLDYENMEVFVFDRYGRLMKQFKGIQQKSLGEEGWDGTYQSKAMPSGDYWYLIKLNDSEGREFTGHFTLYRR